MLGKSPGNPGGSGPPIKEGGIPPKWGRGNIGEVANVSVPILKIAIFLILPFDFGTIFSSVFQLFLRMLKMLPVQKWTDTVLCGIFSPKLIIVVL